MSKLAPVFQKTRECHMSCAHGDHGCHHSCPRTCHIHKMCAFVTSAVDCHTACAHGDRECHHSCPKVGGGPTSYAAASQNDVCREWPGWT